VHTHWNPALEPIGESDKLHEELVQYVDSLYQPEVTIVAPAPLTTYPVPAMAHQELCQFPALATIKSPVFPFVRGPVMPLFTERLPHHALRMFCAAWKKLEEGKDPQSLFCCVMRSLDTRKPYYKKKKTLRFPMSHP